MFEKMRSLNLSILDIIAVDQRNTEKQPLSPYKVETIQKSLQETIDYDAIQSISESNVSNKPSMKTNRNKRLYSELDTQIK